jgi:hypothetical protein
MTTAEHIGRADPGIPVEPPRRPWQPAWAGQALIWVVVIGFVAGPLVPLVYSSVRSKPIYLPGGVFTFGAYGTLFADPAYWTKPLCVKGLGWVSSGPSSRPSVAVVLPRVQVVRPRCAAGAPP